MLATVDIIAAVDGQAHDASPRDGVFDLVDTTATLITTKTSGGGAEERAVLEFDLTSIPVSTIQSATFLYFTTAVFSPATIGIYGYAGDGSISLADATETNNLVASLSGTLGAQSVDVTSFLQDLITNGESFAGLVLQNELPNGGIKMRSSEAGGTWPTLNVIFETSSDPSGDHSGDPISDAIEKVHALEDKGELTARDAKHLVKHLNKAQDELERCKPNKAIKELNKFIKDVDKRIKKNKLSDDSGQALIDLANGAIDDAGGLISDVIEKVHALQDEDELTAKDAKKLTKRLNKALDKLEGCRSDKAIKELNKFIKDVNKRMDKDQLSDSSGQVLIDLAILAIDDIMSGSTP